MRSIFAAVAVVLLLGSTVYGQCCGAPSAAYYPSYAGYAYAAPVYAYPAPYYAYRAPYYAYRAPYYAYRVPVVAAYPYVAYSPVAAAPIVAPPAVWYGPAVIVRSKVYIPGRPLRNVVTAVLP